MRRARGLRRALPGCCWLALPLDAAAHGFGRLYNLPVPFWLYAWGAASVIVLSFLLVTWFASRPTPPASPVNRAFVPAGTAPALRHLLPLKLVSVLLLLLCIATGWFGNGDAHRNFSMTFFWVVFALGFTYLTALFGDFYAVLNPWRAIAAGLGRLWRGYTRGRIRYRDSWGDWPALALYLGFIWFELFGLGRPLPLARMLTAYSVLNLVGVWLVGSQAWFRHGEFFAVFLRLIALISPLDHHAGAAPGRLRWRRPLAGLVQNRPRHLSTVVFVLAMLSTTSFDGLRATQWWVQLFWADPTGLVTRLAGERPLLLYASLRPWYIGWETFCLLLSPFLYFAAYWLCLLLAKSLTRSPRPVKDLALDFAYSLLPIALVYHLTHYATLMLTQGLKIVSLASDPFGWGWDLFGTAMLWRAPILPGMGLVWHAQMGLILLGHVAAVAAAHLVASRVLPTRRQVFYSQLPMLALMVALTLAGLWILAQPLTTERLR